MAIKGCTRQTVVLRGKRNSMFDVAYFIVKADVGAVRKYDLVREANRIIEESCFCAQRKRRANHKILFFYGMAAGALAVGLSWMAVVLLL